MFYFSYLEVWLGKQACKGTVRQFLCLKFGGKLPRYATDFVLAYVLDYFLKHVRRCVYKSNSKAFKTIRKL